MKKQYKRSILAILLSLALVVTYMPASFIAYAVDDENALTYEETTDENSDPADSDVTESDPEPETGQDSEQQDEVQDEQPEQTDTPDETASDEVLQTEDASETGENVDYVKNDGVSAFVLQGDAAESEEAAVDALTEEANLSKKDARALAGELFTVGQSSDDASAYMLDGSEIEWIKTKWVTKDSAGAPAGDTENNLYVKPDSDDDQSVILQISYSLAGEHDYPKDTISITIPSHMFRDREGNIIGDIILPYAHAPNSAKDFNWDTFGDDIVFTNTRTLDAATKGYIEVAFDGLTPHDLKDMGVSDGFDAYIEVLTHKTHRIGRRSEMLTAQFDTDVKVNNAQKKQSGRVSVVKAANVPAEARMGESDYNGRYKDEKFYVEIWWQVWGETTSNTLYTLTRTDTIADGYAGKVSGATSDDGRTSQVVSDPMYKDGETNYYYYATYYPLSQFAIGQKCLFKNRITFRATEVDDNNRYSEASKNAQVSWTFESPKWEEPRGHFNVHKNGNDGAKGGYLMRHTSLFDGRTFTDEHVNRRFSEPNGFYGIYPNGLNDIRDKGSAEITYTINTIGYIFPWTYEVINPGTTDPATGEAIPPGRIQENYNNKSVTMTTVEEGVCINRRQDNNQLELTPGTDFEYAAVEMLKNVRVFKAVPHNINPDGSWDAESWGDGTFLYSDESDWTKYPDIELQIKRGGDWETWATASWHTGDTKEFKITLHDGSTTTEQKVELPEGTTGFRTIVVAGDKNKNSEIGAISYDVRPVIKLKNSEKMLGVIEDAFVDNNSPSVYIYNNVDQIVTAESDNGGTTAVLPHNRKDGYNEVRGYTTDTKIYPTKEGVQELKDIDAENQVYNIHYTIKIEEQSFISDKRTYEEALADGSVQSETSGVWYDLLPEGVNYKEGSAKLRDPLPDQEYADSILNIRQYPNYKDTGRTLLVIRANRLVPQTVKQEVEGNQTAFYEDIPELTFIGEYPFDAVSEDGDVLHNVVAFESGNESVGTIEDYSGEPDDPLAGRNVSSPKAFSEDPDEYEDEIKAMTNLDPLSDGNRFVYAGTTTNLKKVSAATTGLSKLVSVNNDGKWTSGVYETEEEAPKHERIVYEGGTYSYKLRMESSIGTETKDIRLYDSLENFYAADGNSPLDINAPRWQGEFVGVNTSKLEAKGCDPVVYYSTIENLQLQDEIDPHQGHPVNMDLENGKMMINGREVKIWTKASEYTGDLADVKAVAIDASKKKDKTDFILDEQDVAIVEIIMHAPSGEAAREYIAEKAHAYNNIHMLATTVDKSTGVTNNDSFVRKDYTKVGLEEFKLLVTKDWDDDDNRDGIRPGSIVFHLKAKDNDTYTDVDTGKTVSLPQTDEETGELIWTGEFNNIPYTDSEGRWIEYTIEEDPVDEYTTSSNTVGNETIFTNRHVPETISVTGEKTWENETDGSTRPSKIQVDLYANGEKVATQVVDASEEAGNTWSYAFDDLYKNENGKEITYTVEETVIEETGKSYSSEVNGYHIINTYHPYGDLTIEKFLEGATEKAAETEFAFTFTFTKRMKDENGNVSAEHIRTPFEYDVLDENGEVIDGLSGTVMDGGTVKILGGQKIHVKNIDEYVDYKVEEERNRAFRLVSSSNKDGQIVPNQTAEASFTNRYIAEGSAQFEAFKALENKELIRNMFRYEVRRLNDDGSTTVVARGNNENASDITYTDDEETTVASSTARVPLSKIEYSASDDGHTYTYQIVEVNTGNPGYTYDTTVYYATVKVEDLEGNGHLTCTTHYYDRDPSDPDAVELDEPEQLIFNNKYEAEGDVVLQAWKILKAKDRKLEPEEFTFELCDDQGNVIDTAKNAEDGADNSMATFKTLHFTERDAGKTYHYTAREVIPQEGDEGFDPDIVYDESVFDYYVTVTDEGNGKLSFDVEYKKGDQAVNPEFVNRLQNGGLIISKLISADSEDYDPDHEFRFRIEFDGNTEDIPTEIDPVITHIDDPSSIPGYTPGSGQGTSSDGDDDSMNEPEEPDEETAAASSFSLKSVIDAVRPLEAYAEPASEPFHATSDQLEGKYAYAILIDGSDADSKPDELVFFRSNEALQDKNRQEVTVTDIKGNTYEGILFSAYGGNSDLGLGLEHRQAPVAGYSDVPWYGTYGDVSYDNAIKSVRIAEGQAIKPENTYYWFYTKQNLTSVDLSRMDTSIDTDMSRMFYQCSRLTSLDLSGFDGSSVKSTQGMFYQCTSLNSVDLRNFKTPELEVVKFMFYNCSALTEIDISQLDITNAQSLENMFGTCRMLTTIKQSFGRTAATSAKSMFSMCNKLDNLDLSRLQMPNATDLSYMFYYCHAIKDIDLSSINTTNALENVSHMFEACSHVRRINIETLNTTGATNMKSMFGTYRDDNNNEWQNGAVGILDIESITIGPNFSFKGTNIELESEQAYFPTNGGWDVVHQGHKWIREDRNAGPYYPRELHDEYTSDMSGTWVWDLQLVISFMPEDENTYGSMSSLIIPDYLPSRYITLPKNKFVKPGYRFSHWDDHQTGNPVSGEPFTRTYPDEGKLYTSFYTNNQKADLYAVFEKIDNSSTSDNGVFYITLHGFEQALLEDLPADLNYRVYEEDETGGWHEVGSGNTSGVIEPNTYPNAWFENEYNPDRTTVTLEGVKLLDEQGAPADSYEFVLREGENEIEKISVAPGGAIKFSTIEYTSEDIGTHTYTIEEVVPENEDPAIDYDRHQETVTVAVEEKNGALTAIAKYDDDRIVFRNSTNPGSLKLEKKTEGSDSDQSFSFKVRFVDKNGEPYTESIDTNTSGAALDSNIPDSEGYVTGTVKGNGFVEFNGIPAGTRYSIDETDLPDGWALASATGVSGTIAAGATQSAVLNNKYTARGSVELIIHKELVGGDLKTGDFEFELLNENGELIEKQSNSEVDETDKSPELDEYGDPVVDDEGNAVYEDNPWKGTAAAVFDAINYTKSDEGDHTYYIREVVPADAVNADGVRYAEATDEQKQAGGFFKDGMTYDSRLITAVVTVVDNGDGTLKTKVVYKDGNKTVDGLFSNKLTGSLSISKVVEKGSPAVSDQEFTFRVTVRDEKSEPLTGAYETVNADGSSGTARFNDEGVALFTFKDGETVSIKGLPIGSTYQVTEDPVGGQAADGTDDWKGWTVVTKDGDAGTITTEPAEATITNTYDAVGQAEIEVHKELRNKPLTEGAFTFGLYDSNNNLVTSESNDADGAVKFTPIAYTLDDLDGEVSKTFVYYVTEMEGSMPGVRNDASRHKITVVVTDKGDGTLEAVPSEDSIGIDFVNTYSANGNMFIKGTKTVVNRAFKEGDVWTFRLEPTGGRKGDSNIPAAEVPMPLDENNNRKDVDEFVLDKDSGMVPGETTASFEFGRIFFTLDDVGTYNYKVTETAGNIQGITYDTRIYNVTVTVTDNNNGKLNITKTYQVAPNRVNVPKSGIGKLIEGIKDFIDERIPGGEIRPVDPGHVGFDPGDAVLTTQSADFSNVYNASGTATVGARKEMTDNYWGDLKEFKVGIEPVSAKDAEGNDIAGPMPMPEETTLTLTNTEPEKFFSAISFAEAGTYTYVLYEIVPEDAKNADGVEYKDATPDQLDEGGFVKDGIIYDVKDHTVTIKMEDLNETGQLTATEIKYDGQVRTSALIRNTYTAEGTTDLAVSKVLDGRDFLRGDSWTFDLEGVLEGDTEGTADVPMPKDADGRTVTSVTITPDTSSEEALAESIEKAFGTISYSLKDAGKTYVYTITETGEIAGVTNADPIEIRVTVSDNGDGTLTIAKTPDASSYEFVNTYEAEGKVDLRIEKKLTGREFLDGDRWTFTVTGNGPMPKDENGNEVTSVGITPKADDADSAKTTFGTMTYTLADVGKTYTYEITETGEVAGVTNAAPVKVTVKVVSDNGDGTLKIEKTPDTESYEFVNTYEAEGTADLSITKVLEGREFLDGDEWTFTVTGNGPMPKNENGREVTSVAVTPKAGDADSATAVFGTMTYTLEDVGKTYTYEITETGEVAGVTNAEPVKVTVEVVRDNGDGTLEIRKTPDDASYEVINVYRAEGSTDLNINKVLDGRDFRSGDKWTFTVTGDGPMPKDAAGNEVTSVTVAPKAGDAESVKATFGTMTYTLADVGKTYTYEIAETGEVAGVTNAKPVKVTVEVVKDNGDGTLEIRKAPDKASYEFTNIYEAEGSTDLSVSKALEGRDFRNGDSWTFTVTGDGPMPKDEAGNEVTSVVISPKAGDAESAKATFGKLTYTLADAGKTYTYRITETGEVAGVTNAEPVDITVTVSDNGNGTLDVKKTPDKAAYEFTNVYDAEGSTDLSIRKVLRGREFKDSDSWTFTVTGNGPMPVDEEGNEVTSVVISPKAGDDESAMAAFGTMNYTLADAGKTFTYKISESGKIANVKNAKPIEFTVTVSDNGDGTLTAEKDPDDAVFVFVNEYNEPPITPDTGDNNMIILWTATGLFSAILIMLMAMIRRRKRGQE